MLLQGSRSSGYQRLRGSRDLRLLSVSSLLCCPIVRPQWLVMLALSPNAEVQASALLRLFFFHVECNFRSPYPLGNHRTVSFSVVLRKKAVCRKMVFRRVGDDLGVAPVAFRLFIMHSLTRADRRSERADQLHR